MLKAAAVLFVLSLVPSVIVGQQPSPLIKPPAAFTILLSDHDSPPAGLTSPFRQPGPSRNYSKEFGIGGAAALGILALVFATSACDSDNTSNSCIYPVAGATVVGALIGGVTGLFVGSAIGKSEGADAN